MNIAATPDACFDVAADFERYPVWAADVKHARVVDRDDQGRATRVDYRAAALGRSVRYVLDYDLSDAPTSFSWKLVEGDMLRALEGRYLFAPVDSGTDVTYDLTVDLAIPLPGLVKRRAAGRIVTTALQDLKHAVEARAVARASTVETHVEAHVEGHVEGHVEPEEPVQDDAIPEPDDDQATHFDSVGAEERSLPQPSHIEVAITELLGAVPEVRDHLLAAADELLDAAKALLDAADRVVRQQREGSP